MMADQERASRTDLYELLVTSVTDYAIYMLDADAPRVTSNSSG